MHQHPLYFKAVEMRKQGCSYKEIKASLGISLSTLHYMLKDVVLTEEQRNRLQRKMCAGGKFAAGSQDAADRSSKGGKAVWAKHRKKMLNNLDRGRRSAKRHKTYAKLVVVKTELVGKYRYVVVHGHPMANERGRILEHRYVISEHLRRKLTEDEVVHHKDGNTLNNSIDNLELLPNAAAHSFKHHPNMWITVTCTKCGDSFLKRRAQMRGKNVFCSRSCSTSYYGALGVTGRKRTTTRTHGTEYYYLRKKCRCRKCKDAHAEKAREARAKKNK